MARREFLAIGVSAGGLDALSTILRGLGADFPMAAYDSLFARPHVPQATTTPARSIEITWLPRTLLTPLSLQHFYHCTSTAFHLHSLQPDGLSVTE